MIRVVFILALLGLLNSCWFDSKFNWVNQEFEVGYTSLPGNRNVYYRSQGVFSHKCVVGTNSTDRFIFVKLHPYIEYKMVVDSMEYYVINCSEYIEDPRQEESKGLYGPYSKLEMIEIEKKHKILDYNWIEYSIK